MKAGEWARSLIFILAGVLLTVTIGNHIYIHELEQSLADMQDKLEMVVAELESLERRVKR